MDKFFFVLVNVGNILSVIYNIPQMWHTYKMKKATDISIHFLWMRLTSSIIWVSYCLYYSMWDVLVSWAMSLVSTVMIMYYKIYPGHEMIELREVT